MIYGIHDIECECEMKVGASLMGQTYPEPVVGVLERAHVVTQLVHLDLHNRPISDATVNFQQTYACELSF